MENPAAGGSVTQLICNLKMGDRSALEKLWRRYFPDVARHAKKVFGSRSRAVRDEEDIALSALGVLQDSSLIEEVKDRDELLRLLFMVSRNKVISERRFQGSKSRGGGNVSLVSDLDPGSQHFAMNVAGGLLEDQMISEMNEQYDRLMAILPKESYREIVRLRLSGLTVAQVAEALNVVERTIQRKLKLIEDIWRYVIRQDR